MILEEGHQPFASPGEALEHYGVKGMQWGVRKERTPAEELAKREKKEARLDERKTEAANYLRIGDSKKDFEDARKDAKWLKSDVRNGGFTQSTTERKVFEGAQKSMKPELKAINKKPEYSSRAAKKELKRWGSPLNTQYEKETTDLFVKHMKLSAEKHLDPSKKNNTSPSGKWQRDLKIGKSGSWIVGIKQTDKVQHAADDAMDFVLFVRPIRNADGLIEDFQLVEDEQAAAAHAATLMDKGADFLEHYGVKGMRWGVRKEDDTKGREKGKGEVGFIDPVSAVYIGLFLAFTAKTARDLVRLSRDSGERFQKQNANVPWKKKPELAKKAPPATIDSLFNDVVKPTNPAYPKSGTKMNCRRCTFAYEMRRRGLDVKATPSHFAVGQDDQGVKTATMSKDKKFESIWGEKQIATPNLIAQSTPAERSKMIFDAIDSHPDGARGELGVGWQFGGGHSMAWERVRGESVIFDTQSREVYRKPEDFHKFAQILHDGAVTRTDNKTLDEHYLRRWAVNHD